MEKKPIYRVYHSAKLNEPYESKMMHTSLSLFGALYFPKISERHYAHQSWMIYCRWTVVALSFWREMSLTFFAICLKTTMASV